MITFSGSVDTIFKAFSLACRLLINELKNAIYSTLTFGLFRKLWEFVQLLFFFRKLWEFVRGLSEANNPRPLVLRLAVPAQQCGSIIGKQVDLKLSFVVELGNKTNLH